MDPHEVQEQASMIVSQFLTYCLKIGMVDEILAKHYKAEDVPLIKTEIGEIAERMYEAAEYHKSMMLRDR